MPPEVVAAVALLAIAGLLALYSVLARVRLDRLRLGARTFAVSRPLDFAGRTLAIPTLGVGAVCLIGASYLVWQARTSWGVAPEVPGRPLEALALFDAAADKDKTVIRLIEPDTMAAYAVASAAGDVSVSVDAEVRVGPSASVVCVAFRTRGKEIRPGQAVRTAGDHGWPDSGYMTCLSNSASWSLAKFVNGEPELIKPFQPWGDWHSEGGNHLAVEAKGEKIVVSINNVKAAEVTDGTYVTGAVQVVCGTPPEARPAAVCHFRNIKVATPR